MLALPKAGCARNPQGSTPSFGHAPARRFETCAHRARMWQPKNLIQRYYPQAASCRYLKPRSGQELHARFAQFKGIDPNARLPPMLDASKRRNNRTKPVSKRLILQLARVMLGC